MKATIAKRQISEHVWQLSDADDCRCYVVCGNRDALLVDTMGGLGNVRVAVAEVTALPVTVALTHRHYDHVCGAYAFGHVLMSAADDGHWEFEEGCCHEARPKIARHLGLGEGELPPVTPELRPQVDHIADGDSFDLGGAHVDVVGLPGHTVGSLGYVVREDRVLLSGDAVTPIMCLFFEESLPIAGYRATLARMGELPFDEFWTGHHGVGFRREDLASFELAAAFAESRPYGMEWVHGYLPRFTGSLYVAPEQDLTNADSPEFRALIGPYVPRPRRHRRKK